MKGHQLLQTVLELQCNNFERLGDLVETGLGVLYLATIFPETLSILVKEPGVMWRRMETSMTYKVKWTDPPNFGTSTGQGAPSLVTTNEVEAIKQTLKANP